MMRERLARFISFLSRPMIAPSKLPSCSSFTRHETDPTAKHLKPYVAINQGLAALSGYLGLARDGAQFAAHYQWTSKSVVQDYPRYGTNNVFIECTATDLTKANIVLDTVVTMLFSQYVTTNELIVFNTGPVGA
jgi:hypothetical protein